jgi:hypothetical protein
MTQHIPPATIDGAQVLAYADLSGITPTGNTRHIVGGHETSDFDALVIARHDDDQGVYLLYCDETWEAVTDTFHLTVDDAIAQAEFEYGTVSFQELAD